MSTAKIDGLKTDLLAAREAISQLPSQSAYTGNAMSAINHSLDNLKWEQERLAKEEKLDAERRAKNLEEARKVVAAADVAAKEAKPAATPSPSAKAPTPAA